MATQQEKQDYIDRMVSTRGYAQEYHKILVQNDYDVAVRANALVEEVLLKDRLLDRRTKELIFITGLTLLRAERRQIQDHIKVALALGISKEMILEAIELAFMGGGFIAVQAGVLAWQEVVGADRVEPTVDALEAYKARGGQPR
jgi:4-carboxymuconolactone decarboxylase